jgi:hypothetical protein
MLRFQYKLSRVIVLIMCKKNKEQVRTYIFRIKLKREVHTF